MTDVRWPIALRFGVYFDPRGSVYGVWKLPTWPRYRLWAREEAHVARPGSVFAKSGE